MSPPMPHHHDPMKSPTMSQVMADEREDVSHVTRGEFRLLRSDVHEIKQALLGDMAAGNGVLAQHHAMRKQVAMFTKVAWLAVIGAAGMIGTAVWNLITAKHP